MPRLPRRVEPGVPHHVTQRGTNRDLVFLTDTDRQVYLDLLGLHSSQAGLRILAYCLMPNHVHLVAIPDEPDSLAVTLRRTHGRYAQYFNARNLRSGHLWQNRFFSCALGRTHLFAALRYVERNPVRASLVEQPEHFAWSSAAPHLGFPGAAHLLDLALWRDLGGPPVWRQLLITPDDQREIRKLRRATHTGAALPDAPARKGNSPLPLLLTRALSA